MVNFYLGCAVWSYQGWVGNFYPSQTRASDFLRLYSERLTAVEANTTFYAIPNVATLQRWCEQTPASFRFCPKFPKSITHQGLLTPLIPAAADFIATIAELKDRLGVVFAQLPPSYSPVYFDDLTEFCRNLTKYKISLGVEVRHPDWFIEPFNEQLNDLLTQLGITRVLLDTRPIYNSPDDPQLNSLRRKPKLPLQPTLTNNVGLIRFISHPQSQYNQIYLAEWVNRLTDWLSQGKQIYFVVHCPLEERSPETARSFDRLLRQQLSIPVLPWEELELPPTQLELF